MERRHLTRASASRVKDGGFAWGKLQLGRGPAPSSNSPGTSHLGFNPASECTLLWASDLPFADPGKARPAPARLGTQPWVVFECSTLSGFCSEAITSTSRRDQLKRPGALSVLLAQPEPSCRQQQNKKQSATPATRRGATRAQYVHRPSRTPVTENIALAVIGVCRG